MGEKEASDEPSWSEQQEHAEERKVSSPPKGILKISHGFHNHGEVIICVDCVWKDNIFDPTLTSEESPRRMRANSWALTHLQLGSVSSQVIFTLGFFVFTVHV